MTETGVEIFTLSPKGLDRPALRRSTLARFRAIAQSGDQRVILANAAQLMVRWPQRTERERPRTPAGARRRIITGIATVCGTVLQAGSDALHRLRDA